MKKKQTVRKLLAAPARKFGTSPQFVSLFRTKKEAGEVCLVFEGCLLNISLDGPAGRTHSAGFVVPSAVVTVSQAFLLHLSGLAYSLTSLFPLPCFVLQLLKGNEGIFGSDSDQDLLASIMEGSDGQESEDIVTFNILDFQSQ